MRMAEQKSDKPKKGARLTARKERFAQAMAAGQTQREAAINAGYAVSTANKGAHFILHDPAVMARVGELLDKSGATLEKSFRVLNEAHDAMSKDKRNHEVRLKAARENFKLRGLTDGDDGQPKQSPTQIIIALIEERKRRGLSVDINSIKKVNPA